MVVYQARAALSTTRERRRRAGDRSPLPRSAQRPTPLQHRAPLHRPRECRRAVLRGSTHDQGAEPGPEVRRLPGREGHFVRSEARRAVRLSRAERRRQDHHHQDAHDAAAAQRAAPSPSTGSIRRNTSTKCAAASASCSRTRASTSELTAWENMDLHGVLYRVPRKMRHERTEQLLEALRAVGAEGSAHEDVLRRHEAPAGDRARLPAHAEDPVPRRADARPRSAESQSALDAREGAERVREGRRCS